METKEFFEELLKKRQIWIGDINPESCERVITSIAFLNAKDSTQLIQLMIDSNGGNVSEGLIIYDSITLSKAPTEGVVCGAGHSIASVILQGCLRRKASRHSTILIHNIGRQVRLKMVLPDAENPYGKIDVDAIVRSWGDLATRSTGNIIKILSEKTGRTPTEIITAMNTEKVFAAEEAKEFGLVDEVI